MDNNFYAPLVPMQSVTYGACMLTLQSCLLNFYFQMYSCDLRLSNKFRLLHYALCYRLLTAKFQYNHLGEKVANTTQLKIRAGGAKRKICI